MTKPNLYISTIILCLFLALAAQPSQAATINKSHAEKSKDQLFTQNDNVELDLLTLTDSCFANADKGKRDKQQSPKKAVSHRRGDGIFPDPFMNHPGLIPDAADQCRPGRGLGCRNDNRRFSGANPALAPVPVPASLLLIGSGLAGLMAIRRQRRSL